MSKSFVLVASRLTLLILCALPLIVEAAAKKEALIDTSIIEQSESLRAYMTAPQRLIYIKTLELIKEGESDIRSGETLLQQKQSILDPNKDLGAIYKRGEQLVQDGQAKVTQGQQQLVELLTLVQSQKQHF